VGFVTAVVVNLIMSGALLLHNTSILQVKKLPWQKTAPVACAYVGFVIFNNLSIQVNTVGFYQISKIMITPVVVLVSVEC
jgi:solute carrier family 35 protein E3